MMHDRLWIALSSGSFGHSSTIEEPCICLAKAKGAGMLIVGLCNFAFQKHENGFVSGPSSFNILEGHSKATMLLICNNAAQGILSSFFFKYADTILKKYSSTVATIFTGIASAALFGHKLTMNFILGISIVFISMHQFFSPLAKVKEEPENEMVELMDAQNDLRSKDSFIDMAAGANEEATHRVGPDERQPLLPR